MNDDCGMALISAPAEAGQVIARALIENRFAACVQVLPEASSYYWWKGKVEHDTEVVLLVKTLASRLPDIEFLLKEIHPYEVPELVFFPFAGGSSSYLKWLTAAITEGETAIP